MECIAKDLPIPENIYPLSYHHFFIKKENLDNILKTLTNTLKLNDNTELNSLKGSIIIYNNTNKVKIQSYNFNDRILLEFVRKDGCPFYEKLLYLRSKFIIDTIEHSDISESISDIKNAENNYNRWLYIDLDH